MKIQFNFTDGTTETYSVTDYEICASKIMFHDGFMWDEMHKSLLLDWIIY